MKIQSVSVEDPRTKGTFKDPVVIIEVDEEVYENDLRKYPPPFNTFRLSLCGPFFGAEEQSGVASWRPADLGEFNKLGLYDQQLASIEVRWLDKGSLRMTTDDTLSMPVPRLRRLLRKYTGPGFSGWTIIIDESEALQGRLVWRVELNEPTCFGDRNRCHHGVTSTILYRGAHLNFCPTHKAAWENRMAAESSNRRNQTREGAR